MDDLFREFLTETSESLDTVDNQLVEHGMAAMAAAPAPAPVVAAPAIAEGTLVLQTLERELRPKS